MTKSYFNCILFLRLVKPMILLLYIVRYYCYTSVLLIKQIDAVIAASNSVLSATKLKKVIEVRMYIPFTSYTSANDYK